MITSIFKYTVALQRADGRVEVSMPRDAQLLDVQVQRETLCLWARVAPDAEMVPRTFAVFGTGHAIDSDAFKSLAYVGTAQLHGGALVLHVFEERAS